MKNIISIIAACFGCMMFAGAAFAGGGSFEGQTNYSVAPERATWNHCYTGVKAGAEFGNVEAVVSGLSYDYSQKGYLIAGAVGCRYQGLNNLVYGIEFGGGVTNADGTVASTNVEKDSFLNVKGSLGYSFGRFKPGLFLGYEWSEDDLGDVNTWIGGIEANYRLAPRWSLDFTAQTTLDPGDGAYNGIDIDTDNIKFLAGFSYVFPVK